MIKESYELLIELWLRLKSHIPAKERLEAADTIATLFDEYGHIDKTILKEDLDKALLAALRSRLVEDDDEDEDDQYEDGYGDDD